MNKSTLFETLDNMPEVYSDVIVKRASAQPTKDENGLFRPEIWGVYAVTADNKNKPEAAQPVWPFILITTCKGKAAAGSAAGKYRRWIGEYNDVY